MKYLGDNWAIKLSNGNLSEAKYISKFGANPDVGTTMEDIWETGGVYTWLQAAVKLEAISSSVNDTVAGSGAQQIVVQGLDKDFNEIEETISMNGTSASTATTQSFLRVHRAYVSRSGTYQSTTLTASQAGTITIRTQSAGATHITLAAVGNTWMGQSEVLRFTIPHGYTGFLTNITLSSDTSKTINGFMFQRTSASNTTTNITAKRLVWRTLGLSGPIDWKPLIPLKFEHRTDIWMTARVPSVAASIEGTFDLILIKTDIVNQW